MHAAKELSATLLIEMTNKDQMQEWLPKLVGIERSIRLRLGDGEDADLVSFAPESAQADMLTRETVTL